MDPDAATAASSAPPVDVDAPTAPPAAAAGGGRDHALLTVDRAFYVIEEKLGTGGMGEVFTARDRRADRVVALKLVQPRHAGDAGIRARFEREARITAQLQHPAIVPVYEVGRWPDGTPYYAMKKVDGEPLDRLVARAGSLEARLALLPSVLAVADAIGYAHSRGIIHRDLKPGNILVGPFGETIVIDWGLAKRLDDGDLDGGVAPEPGAATTADGAATRDPTPAPAPAEAALTRADDGVMGTLSYMPPEQIAPERVDARADVYALGATLYHVLAGIQPYHDQEARWQRICREVPAGRGRGATTERVRRMLAEPPTPLRALVPEIPTALLELVDAALTPDAAGRLMTARELADALRAFEAERSFGPLREEAARRAAERARADLEQLRGQQERERLRRQRRRTVAALVAGFALVAAVVGSFAIERILRETRATQRQRDRALAEANAAVLAQARAVLADDPAETLAWLRRLDPAGPSWDAARVLAADALARPMPVRILHGLPGRARRDADRAVAIDQRTVWVADPTTGDARSYLVADPASSMRSPPELCDDHARMVGRLEGPGTAPDGGTFELDLSTGVVTRPAGSYLEARARCRRAGWLVAAGAPPATELRLWDPASATFRVLATGHFRDAQLTGDGTHLVALDVERDAIAWLDESGRRVDTRFPLPPSDAPEQQPGRIAAASRDGHVVVVSAVTGRAYQMSVVDTIGAKSWTLEVPGDRFAVAPDGAWVAVASDTGVDVYDVARGQLQVGLSSDESGPVIADAVDVSDDGRWLLVVRRGLGPRVWPIDAPWAARDLVGQGRWADAWFLPGDRVVTTDDQTARVWVLAPPSGERLGWLTAPTFSPGGHRLARVTTHGIVRQDLDRGEADTLDLRAAGAALAVSDRGDVIIAASADHVVRVWRRDGSVEELGRFGPSTAVAVAWSATGAPMWWDQDALVVGDASPQQIAIPGRRGAGRPVDTSLVPSPSGGWVAVTRMTPSGVDETFLVELASGKATRLDGVTGRRPGFSPDGRQLAAVTATELVFRDLASMASRTVASGSGLDGGVVAFSRDGRRVAAVGTGNAVVVEVATGRVVAAPALRGGEPPLDARVSARALATLDVAGRIRLTALPSGETRTLATGGLAMHWSDELRRCTVVTNGLLQSYTDDLPHDPPGLARFLAGLPYSLRGDGRGSDRVDVAVGPDPGSR